MLVDKDNKCAGLRNTNNNEINLEEGSGNSRKWQFQLDGLWFEYICSFWILLFQIEYIYFFKKNSFIE
jgi:hypothetical protein